MKDSAAVNHPSHYEKGNGHIECIDLLALICKGYKDIYANELGQSKYLYRMGSKTESDLSRKEKAIQDVKKSIWYLNDFEKRIENAMAENSLEFCDVIYYNHNKYYDTFEANLIAKEFTYDKPEAIKENIGEAVKLIYRFSNLREVNKVIQLLEEVVRIISDDNFKFDN